MVGDKKNTIFEKLNINKLTLEFRDERIEKQYRYEYFKKSIFSFRLSFLIITVLYALFGILDMYASRQFIGVVFAIRYLIVVPTLVVVWLLSFLPFFNRFWQWLVALCYLIGGLGIAYMLLLNPGSSFYYGGLFLVFIAGYFFIKLHFKWAVIPGILIIIFYNITPYFNSSLLQEDLQSLFIINAFYISANIIAAVALYNGKLTERSEFHQHLQLLAQQEKIKGINESLEETIKKRTELLETRNKILNEEIDYRKRVEDKLIEAKQQAEESDRLKSAFLTNLSHEIRTPMNGIIGFMDMINDPAISAEEQGHYIDIIKQCGNRLLQTINDIIEISRIEAGELSEIISEVNLDNTFKNLYEILLPEARAKNISLKFQENKENYVIRTDAYKLENILINLIRNAIKFTETGSVEIGYDIVIDKLRFYVKDTGKGIPQDRQKAIFDRFVQADMGLSRGYEGTGLGLSICKAYVEILGGKIWLESEVNKGSIFYFTINYNPVNLPVYKKESGSQNSKPGKIKALVAEDDEISFDLIDTILQNEQIATIRAYNGHEAVEMFKSNSDISIIFMDIKMPVMDGLDATKEIRKYNNKIPIIAQTAFALSGDREKALDAGCNDYLSKPIKRQDLVRIIEEFI